MNKEIFGGLIGFENNEKFTEFIDTMDKATAIKIIELSIEYGLKYGLYDLNESFCLYNCISKIKEGNEKIEAAN
jgi:hypothetical protein